VQRYIDSLRRGWRRPEVRRHPLQAISKRLVWRWHWKRSPGVPIVLESWWRDLRIALPQTNNASLLFYRSHSDPTLLWLLQALLSPRMTFLDVGAHIGEFTLVGAKMVGGDGKVLAVEPLPPCAEAIRHNAALNGMAQVRVCEGALSDRSGKIGFMSDPERSGGWIARSASQVTFEAQCWSLDDLLSHVGITSVNLAKIDASGNELAVLRGAGKTLPAGRVRTLVMKLYNPDVVRERFGHDAHESLALLQQWGFQLKLVVRQEAFPVFRAEEVDCHFDRLVYSHLLVATMD